MEFNKRKIMKKSCDLSFSSKKESLSFIVKLTSNSTLFITKIYLIQFNCTSVWDFSIMMSLTKYILQVFIIRVIRFFQCGLK